MKWVDLALFLLALSPYTGECAMEGAFMDFILFNTSIYEHNSGSLDAFKWGGIPSFGGGTTSEASHNPLSLILGHVERVDGRRGLILGDFGLGAPLLNRTYAGIFAAEPLLFDRFNRSWIPSHNVTLAYGVGCATNPAQKGLGNFAGGAGEGYHREILVPVKSKTELVVGGIVCVNKTRYWGRMGSGNISYVDVGHVACEAGKPTERMTLSHTCEAASVYDSSYYVVGWKAECDFDSIRETIYSRCVDSSCKTSKPESSSARFCRRKCTQIAKTQSERLCRPLKSKKAQCPTEVPKGYGMPSDGSSIYMIEQPKYADLCKRYCDVVADHSNSCFNNRVHMGRSHVLQTIDILNGTNYGGEMGDCAGSYWTADGVVEGDVAFNISRGLAQAFVFGDVLSRNTHILPKHIIYESSPDKQMVGFVDALGGAEFGGLDFAVLESVENRHSPLRGLRFSLQPPAHVNGTLFVRFKYIGVPEDLLSENVSFFGYPERLARFGKIPCSVGEPCMRGGYCVDGFCIPLSDAAHQIMLSDCLGEGEPTSCKMDGDVGDDGYTVELHVSSKGVPISGASVTVYCRGFSGYMGKTNLDGGIKYPVDGLGDKLRCSGRFMGGLGYAPCLADFKLDSGRAWMPKHVGPLAGCLILIWFSKRISLGCRSIGDLIFGVGR